MGGIIVGLMQCGLIWAGLKQMRRASESRDRQIDNQHRETMRALEALIERTGGAASLKTPWRSSMPLSGLEAVPQFARFNVIRHKLHPRNTT